MATRIEACILFTVLWCVLVVSESVNKGTGNYLIGIGRSDITGPAAEVNMMGYANPAQLTHGIHFRQYSRAFIIHDVNTKSRVLFVNLDACMLSQGVKLEVIKRLKSHYGDLYTERNVAISGIHTHSGPGGFHQYILFDLTSLGFVNQTFMALLDGIVESIDIAHASMKPGNIYVNSGELLESNINRSPAAYVNNPAKERAEYQYNVDKGVTVLKFTDTNNKAIGMLSWFAVHCTSMNNTNELISGDNKGYASYLFEQAMNPGHLPGHGSFVAAFAQSNEGDVSPNTAGPKCLDTGLPCDILTSTCNGKSQQCVAFGPGKDMVESTRIIAEYQFNKTMDLYNSATTLLSGSIDFRHTYVDMTQVQVQVNSSYQVKTCKPAMGYSFAAGTTDGPGAFSFTQGTTSGNPFWNLVRDFIHKPTEEQIACHAPKPILVDTGEITFPYKWQPDILDVQILKLGQLAIIAVPGEFTTMSGRRLRSAVAQAMSADGAGDVIPVIAGLTNDYADYIATYEEYQIQRYEGASTIYGPYTLNAFIQEFTALAHALAQNTTVPLGPNPPNLMDRQLSFLPPVVFDAPPIGKHFGQVVQDVSANYQPGDRVTASFVSGHPRNNIRRGDTFLAVEKQLSNNTWAVVARDNSWETRFMWARTDFLLGQSEVTVTWDIPSDQSAGTYRISIYGDWKCIIGTITPYIGTSSEFTISTTMVLRASEIRNLFSRR